MPAFADLDLENAYFQNYDAVMAQWRVPVETVDVSGRYGTTRITSAGPASAPPLVLLHGLGATSAMWYSIVGALAGDSRVRAVDIMGEPGRSRHTGAPIDTVDEMVAWLAETFDLLDLPPADLCGHSFGGHLALRFTLAHPTRVRRLVLLDPVLAFAPLPAEFAEFAQNRDVHPTFENARAMFAPGVSGSGPAREAYLDLLAHGAAHFPASPVPTPELPDALPALPVPTLVVLAGGSAVHDPEAAAQAAQEAGARTAVVPGVGHGLVTDAPGSVADLIGDHLHG
ncbi:alpha/beta fold hydrolase [Mycolicibacterium brisbanense]|uniref:Hydrolase n=1 Tax=Mycolicibacterium brisbanense TaxID=146020 RepID=A0A100W3Y4_9MYCO|nr:alpha/beta fold hydrolase [Mycolicibacterium brisbanense]MCV7157257.1 alpha/beta fold hydrolase [Mycolicibacterium brisbanense]GAS91182.1 hydrolase [Mycolicibacterium brisbanense]